MIHEFRPYVDHPDRCVAELPDTGDTCNLTRDEHDQLARYYGALFTGADALMGPRNDPPDLGESVQMR